MCASAIAIVAGSVIGIVADGQRTGAPLTLNGWVTLYDRDPLDASIARAPPIPISATPQR